MKVKVYTVFFATSHYTKDTYLTTQSKIIHKGILQHAKKASWSKKVDTLKLTILANAVALYGKYAQVIAENGPTQIANSAHTAALLEVGIMRDQHIDILKQSGEFGLNPSYRRRLFKMLKDQKKPDAFDLL